MKNISWLIHHAFLNLDTKFWAFVGLGFYVFISMLGYGVLNPDVKIDKTKLVKTEIVCKDYDGDKVKDGSFKIACYN